MGFIFLKFYDRTLQRHYDWGLSNGMAAGFSAGLILAFAVCYFAVLFHG
jgi:hypothetical protein